MSQVGIRHIDEQGIGFGLKRSGNTPHVKAELSDSTGLAISSVNPVPIDINSVYAQDIWLDQSDIDGFSGTLTDLFDDLHSGVINSSTDNPKEIFIHFYRTVVANAIGLGTTIAGGTFSNVKISIVNSGAVETVVIDESTDDTKYTTQTYQLPVTAGFNAIRVSFHTTDPIALTNFFILKTLSVVARLQAVKPDGTVIDLNATAGGNPKFSLEEIESQISVNSNTQLRVTVFNSSGLEAKFDPSSGTFVNEDYAHYEIHQGNHFYRKNWFDLTNGAVYNFLIITPDSVELPHFEYLISSEGEIHIDCYRDVVVSANGTAVSTFNRNENSSNTATMLLYHTPTITSVGTQIYAAKGGSAQKVGGTIRANDEVVLKANTQYLFRITNDTALNNWIDYLFDWYEHAL